MSRFDFWGVVDRCLISRVSRLRHAWAPRPGKPDFSEHNRAAQRRAAAEAVGPRLDQFEPRMMMSGGDVRIIDDGDAVGYSTIGGAWSTSALKGYQNDSRFATKGDGSKKAVYTFTDLEPGEYRVSANWSAHAERATNTPYTITSPSDGKNFGTFRLNQEVAPNDFTANSGVWEDITGNIMLHGTSLVVTISNDADETVIADGVRIERVGDLPANTAEIQITDGSGGYLFTGGSWNTGLSYLGTTITKTFNIQNVGNADLVLGETGVSVPEGYTLTPPGKTTLAPGESTSFSVTRDQAFGTAEGTLSFTSNDSDEGLFEMNLYSLMTDTPRIIDDGDATGFSYVGAAWSLSALGGYKGDSRFAAAGDGSRKAVYTFNDVTPGVYQIAVTYSAHVERATDAHYVALDVNSGVVLADKTINQELVPSDFTADGGGWVVLANATTIEGSLVTVTLDNKADEVVIADAVRLVRVGDLPGGAAPEVEISITGMGNVLSGTSLTYGELTPGTVVEKTVTIRNIGSKVLDVAGISLPSGLMIMTPYSEILVEPGTKIELPLQLTAGSLGAYTGAIVIENNDANEGIFTLPVSWTVADAPIVIDDGDAGFTTKGTWSLSALPGYQNDNRFATKGDGSKVATWTFAGLEPGIYRVSTTYSAHAERATDAPYTVTDPSNPDGKLSIAVNQELAPSDLTFNGKGWVDLSTAFEVTGDSLVVTLNNLADETVIADAVRVQRVGEVQFYELFSYNDSVTEGNLFLAFVSSKAIVDSQNTQIDWILESDGETIYESTGYSFNYYFNDPLNYILTMQVKRNGIVVHSESRELNVQLSKPEVELIMDSVGPYIEGSAINMRGYLVDSGSSSYEFSWTIINEYTGFTDTFDGPAVEYKAVEDGKYLAKVQVTDSNGQTAYSTLGFLVTDVAPVLQFNIPYELPTEGIPLELDIAAYDPGDDVITQMTVDWGDGTVEVFPYGFKDNPSHTYINGPFDANIVITVINEDGIFEIFNDTIYVRNAPPEADISAPDIAEVGEELEVRVLNVVDVVPDFAEGFVYRIDADGDGVWESESESKSLQYSFTEPGIFYIYVEVEDRDGGVTPLISPIEITKPMPSANVEVVGSTTVPQGSVVEILVSTQNTSYEEIKSLTVDWGDGNKEVFEGFDGSRTFEHKFMTPHPDGVGVIVTLRTAYGEYIQPEVVLSVENVIATAHIGTIQGYYHNGSHIAGYVGGEWNFILDWTDPGFTEPSRWKIDWGDGQIEEIEGNPQFATHVYKQAGEYTPMAYVYDWDTWSDGSKGTPLTVEPRPQVPEGIDVGLSAPDDRTLVVGWNPPGYDVQVMFSENGGDFYTPGKSWPVGDAGISYNNAGRYGHSYQAKLRFGNAAGWSEWEYTDPVEIPAYVSDGIALSYTEVPSVWGEDYVDWIVDYAPGLQWTGGTIVSSEDPNIGLGGSVWGEVTKYDAEGYAIQSRFYAVNSLYVGYDDMNPWPVALPDGASVVFYGYDGFWNLYKSKPVPVSMEITDNTISTPSITDIERVWDYDNQEHRLEFSFSGITGCDYAVLYRKTDYGAQMIDYIEPGQSDYTLDIWSGTYVGSEFFLLNWSGEKSSAMSNIAVGPPLPTYNAPTAFEPVSGGAYGITYGWTDGLEDETGYRVYRKTAGSTHWDPYPHQVHEGKTGTGGEYSLLFESLWEVPMTLGVSAVQQIGGVVIESVIQTLGTATKTAPPEGLTAVVVGFDTVHVMWQDRSANETGYLLEVSTDSGFDPEFTEQLQVTGSNYDVSGLEIDTDYYFRLRLDDPTTTPGIGAAYDTRYIYNNTILHNTAVRITGVKIEIDSNGDGAFETDKSSGGDAGLLVPVNTGDLDDDGVADYEDGYDVNASDAFDSDDSGPSLRFVPIKVILPDWLDPQRVSVVFENESSVGGAGGISSLRLWKKASDFRHKDDIVSFGAGTLLSELVTTGNWIADSRAVLLFLESTVASMSAGDLVVKSYLEIDGDPDWASIKELSITGVEPLAALDKPIVLVNDNDDNVNGKSDYLDGGVGGSKDPQLVQVTFERGVLGELADGFEIRISSESADRIKVWADQDRSILALGGEQLTYSWTDSSQDRKFYIEGINASEFVDDTAIEYSIHANQNEFSSSLSITIARVEVWTITKSVERAWDPEADYYLVDIDTNSLDLLGGVRLLNSEGLEFLSVDDGSYIDWRFVNLAPGATEGKLDPNYDALDNGVGEGKVLLYKGRDDIKASISEVRFQDSNLPFYLNKVVLRNITASGAAHSIDLTVGEATLDEFNQDSRTITVEVLDINGDPVADGTMVEWDIEGDGYLSDYTTETTGGIATVEIAWPGQSVAGTVKATADRISQVADYTLGFTVEIDADKQSIELGAESELKLTARVLNSDGVAQPLVESLKWYAMPFGQFDAEPDPEDDTVAHLTIVVTDEVRLSSTFIVYASSDHFASSLEIPTEILPGIMYVQWNQTVAMSAPVDGVGSMAVFSETVDVNPRLRQVVSLTSATIMAGAPNSWVRVQLNVPINEYGHPYLVLVPGASNSAIKVEGYDLFIKLDATGKGYFHLAANRYIPNNTLSVSATVSVRALNDDLSEKPLVEPGLFSRETAAWLGSRTMESAGKMIKGAVWEDDSIEGVIGSFLMSLTPASSLYVDAKDLSKNISRWVMSKVNLSDGTDADGVETILSAAGLGLAAANLGWITGVVKAFAKIVGPGAPLTVMSYELIRYFYTHGVDFQKYKDLFVGLVTSYLEDSGEGIRAIDALAGSLWNSQEPAARSAMGAPMFFGGDMSVNGDLLFGEEMLFSSFAASSSSARGQSAQQFFDRLMAIVNGVAGTGPKALALKAVAKAAQKLDGDDGRRLFIDLSSRLLANRNQGEVVNNLVKLMTDPKLGKGQQEVGEALVKAFDNNAAWVSNPDTFSNVIRLASSDAMVKSPEAMAYLARRIDAGADMSELLGRTLKNGQIDADGLELFRHTAKVAAKWGDEAIEGGPGRLAKVNDTFSNRPASRYQEQQTGNPSGFGYLVPGYPTEFDNFLNGFLIEAKGVGNAKWLRMEGSGKLDEMLLQAGRQADIARITNTPLKWIVAEEETARILRMSFAANSRLSGIIIEVKPMNWAL